MTDEPERATRRARELGHQLRAQRLDSGLTQERLALNVGIDRSFYVDVESGQHSLSIDRLFAIAEALGTSADQLLAGIE